MNPDPQSKPCPYPNPNPDSDYSALLDRWLVPVTYRYTYVDALTESCHVVGRWRTTRGHRFQHMPVQMCSAEVFRGTGAMIRWTRKRRSQVRVVAVDGAVDLPLTAGPPSVPGHVRSVAWSRSDPLTRTRAGGCVGGKANHRQGGSLMIRLETTLAAPPRRGRRWCIGRCGTS